MKRQMKVQRRDHHKDRFASSNQRPFLCQDVSAIVAIQQPFATQQPSALANPIVNLLSRHGEIFQQPHDSIRAH
jgi:hypothetical protein